MLEVLLRPGGGPPLPAANFGLLYPAADATGWQFVCEENFGNLMSERLRQDARGRVLVPSLQGLFMSEDGCTWTRAGGALADVAAVDVALDPSDGQRLWVLGGDPRSLFLSSDGGATFALEEVFPSELRFYRVMTAPSDPKVLYLAGFRKGVPLVLAVSEDAGRTWAIDLDAAAPFGPDAQNVVLLGVAPDDPRTVYFGVVHRDGDQLWRSTDRGQAPARILVLADVGEIAGFTFGDSAGSLFVAGRDPLEREDRPPARLYVSHDSGQTWMDRPSAADGPRFRCLQHQDGRLYACAGDAPNRDRFLVGVSQDEGESWQPLVRLADVRGVRSCVAAPCAATAIWLCESRGLCEGVPEPPRDAAVDRGGGETAPPSDGGAAPSAGQGCGCALPGSSRPWPGWGAVMIALACLALRRKSRRSL